MYNVLMVYSGNNFLVGLPVLMPVDDTKHRTFGNPNKKLNLENQDFFYYISHFNLN